MLALWLSLALAAEHVVVGQTDTLASIAARLGDPGLVDALRARNQLAPGEQPEVGSVLWVPDGLDGHIDQPATVLATRGPATQTPPGGQPTELSPGDALIAGTTVCTTDGGYVTLRLAAAGTGDSHDDLTMFPETCLTIDATSARGDQRSSLLSLTTGSVAVRQAKYASGAVTVRTKAGLTSGSAGGFRVHVERAASRTEAIGAPARVFGAQRELALDTGYGSRVQEGEAPSEPVKLLLPGAPTAPGEGRSLKRPDFEWNPVDRALTYQVQISAAPDFSDVLRVEGVDEALWYPDRLFLPYRVPGLWWRVASVDRTGFIGTWSEPRAQSIPNGIGP